MSESGRVAIDPAEGCDGEVGKVSYWISLVAKHQSYIIGNWPQLQGVPPQSDAENPMFKSKKVIVSLGVNHPEVSVLSYPACKHALLALGSSDGLFPVIAAPNQVIHALKDLICYCYCY
jgi:hypothetical protein